MPVVSASVWQTRRAKSGWVFRPLPTAVPPTGNSSTAASAADCAFGGAGQLPRPTADLLPQRQGRGIDQVRAADLEDLSPLVGLLGEHPAALLQGRQQVLADAQRHRHVDRRGENIVGALAQVHVIVGMDGLAVGKAVAAAKLDGPVGDHLVGVHIGRGAGTGLEDIHRKLVVEAAVGHLARGGDEGLDLGRGERILA